MRLFHGMAFLLALSTAIGCSKAGDPACLDSDCVHPPTNTCVDADTLREYQALGACDPDSGACEYNYNNRTCDHGCSNDHCNSTDPCAGVVCDQPSDNQCLDAITLRVFDAIGVCIRPKGDCEYGFSDRTCTTSCEDNQCVGQDPCQDVVCDDPPAARCLDKTTIEEYDPVGTCDPVSGRCDYDKSERNCIDGCLKGFCLDLGQDYALVIPAGTQVCSDKRSTWDIFGGYQNRMRITFEDGVVSLPNDQDSFERSWIASVEFGPERTLLTPLANGSFTRTNSAERVDYQFVQAFSDGAKTYTLTYDVWFDPNLQEDRLRIFDELYLSPPITYPVKTIELTVDGDEYERWYFLTCLYDLYLPVQHRVVTADGAELELEERVYSSSDACMLACPTALLQASFQLGQDQRLVQDPFRLAFVDSQHNWFDQFLVVFDDPVDDIHALHFFPADNDAPEKKVDYLDAELNVIRVSLVTNHTTVELWQTFDSDALTVNTCGEYCRDHAGLAEDCESTCIVEGQAIAGRCFTALQWPPPDDWTILNTCDETFDACAGAGRPFIQCCCSRIASDW
jgi:hypothetical protein